MGLSDPGRPFRFEANGSPFAADFNGDGKADVVISGPPATLLFTGNGDGTFSPPIIIAGCSSVSAVADFNGDGKADLICGPTALFFYNTVFLSNGDGTFRASGTVGTFAQAVVTLTADFNNDGNPDVLLRELSGQFAVVLGHGDGTFGAELLITSSTETGELATFPVAAGDFNGDGKIDLVGYSYRGFFIDVLPGNGEGTFGTAVQTNIGANPQPGLVFATGDFNKDGKLDLVAGEAIFAGNGDGTFRFPVFFGSVVLPCVTVTATIPCGYQYVATAVADFNGDGLPDIAAGTVAQGLNSKTVAAISVLLNDSPWCRLSRVRLWSQSRPRHGGGVRQPGTDHAGRNPAARARPQPHRRFARPAPLCVSHADQLPAHLFGSLCLGKRRARRVALRPQRYVGADRSNCAGPVLRGHWIGCGERPCGHPLRGDVRTGHVL
jgi:hypothetical protein